MAKQEWVQLAQTLKSIEKMPIVGKRVSEKLDGQRAVWDGGVTRGMITKSVPWANVEKTDKVPVSTGLWSRLGKAIAAPDWWLDRLPPYPVDGELFAGRGNFQQVESIVRRTVNLNPEAWTQVQYVVFDIPHPATLLADRKIDNTGYKKILKDAYTFWLQHGGQGTGLSQTAPFSTRYNWMGLHLPTNDTVTLLHQETLPASTTLAIDRLNERFEEVLSLGGEGLMLKSPHDIWKPERVGTLLKWKPYSDGEATVVGYTAGKETDKGSKLLGMMGALICKIDAGQFKLSGFTDAERRMTWVETGDTAIEYVATIPGEVVPASIHNPMFPRGSHVTYKYRELTEDKLPKEGRYFRKT